MTTGDTGARTHSARPPLVRELGPWQSAGQIGPTYSKQIVARGLFARELFEELGLSVNPAGRLCRAIERIRDVNDRPSPLRGDEAPEFLRAVLQAHRTIREMALVALAINSRPKCRSAFRLDELRTMLEGAEDEADDPIGSKARGYQHQLLVAAMLARSGLEIRGGEPDVRMAFGSETLGIAAKRIRPSDPANFRARLQERLLDGARQLREQSLRGIVAVNIDWAVADIPGGLSIEALGAGVMERLAALDHAHHWLADRPHVLGVMSLGYFASWIPEPDMARLAGDYASRFETLAQKPDDQDRIRRFFDYFASRLPSMERGQ